MRRAYATAVAELLEKSCANLGQAEIAGSLWMLDEEGVVLDLGEEAQLREVLGELDAVEEREMTDLVELIRVREAHWRKQRRLAYKGLLGGAWEKMLRDWGVDPTVAAATRKKLFEKGMAFGSKLCKVYHETRTGKTAHTEGPVVPAAFEQEIQRMLSAIRLHTQRHVMQARLARMSEKGKIEFVIRRRGSKGAKKGPRRVNVSKQLKLSMDAWLQVNTDGYKYVRRVKRRVMEPENKLTQATVEDYFGSDAMVVTKRATNRESGAEGAQETGGRAAQVGEAIRQAITYRGTTPDDQDGGGDQRRGRGKRLLQKDDADAESHYAERSGLAVALGRRAAKRTAGEHRCEQASEGQASGEGSAKGVGGVANGGGLGERDMGEAGEQGVRDSAQAAGQRADDGGAGLADAAAGTVLRAATEGGRKTGSACDDVGAVGAVSNERSASGGSEGGDGSVPFSDAMDASEPGCEGDARSSEAAERGTWEGTELVARAERRGRSRLEAAGELVCGLANGDERRGCRTRLGDGGSGQPGGTGSTARAERAGGSAGSGATVLVPGGSGCAGHVGEAPRAELVRDTMHDDVEERLGEQHERGGSRCGSTTGARPTD